MLDVQWGEVCKKLPSYRTRDAKENQLMRYAAELQLILEGGTYKRVSDFRGHTKSCLEALHEIWRSMGYDARETFLQNAIFGKYLPLKLRAFLERHEKQDLERQQRKEEQERLFRACKSDDNACRGCGRSAEKWYGCHTACHFTVDENTQRGGWWSCSKSY